MSFYLTFSAAVNLALGFGLAIYLRRRWQVLTAPAWDAEPAAEDGIPPLPAPTQASPAELLPPAHEKSIATNVSAARPLDTRPNVATANTPAEELDADMIAQLLQGSAAPRLDAASNAETPASPPEAPAALRGATAITPGISSAADAAPARAAAPTLADFLDRYRAALERVDDELHTTADHTADTIAALQSAIVEAMTDYATVAADAPLAGAASTVPAALGAERAVFDASLAVSHEKLAKREPSRALHAADAESLLDEVAQLITAVHGMRDAIANARSHPAEDPLPPPGHSGSAMCDAVDRPAFEALFADWRRKDPHRTRRMAAALVDIDQLAQTNARHGHRVGDEIIRQIARLLQTEPRQEAPLQRISGNRFAMLFPDCDLRTAVGECERMRQAVEVCRFRYRDEEIKATVSVGLVELTADDSLATLLARAEGVLRQAKLSGRNRSVLHDGRQPGPVIPPNLSPAERVIEL